MYKPKGKKPKENWGDRQRYFGITKLGKGTKFAWVSMQNKHGWSLGFAIPQRTVTRKNGKRVVLKAHYEYLRNVRFATHQDVVRALKATTVFVKLKH